MFIAVTRSVSKQSAILKYSYPGNKSASLDISRSVIMVSVACAMSLRFLLHVNWFISRKPGNRIKHGIKPKKKKKKRTEHAVNSTKHSYLVWGGGGAGEKGSHQTLT